MREIFALITLTFTEHFFASGFSSPAQTAATKTQNSCEQNPLPSQIKARLNSDFGPWKVQAPENLSKRAHATWADRKPTSCPGIAVGLFQAGTTASYAVLLVPADNPDARYRFLVFSQKPGQRSYEMSVVEKSDDRGASNFFIHKVRARDFFDEASAKRFQLQANELILMVDSGEQEYETDIYFWSNGRFRHEPVDD